MASFLRFFTWPAVAGLLAAAVILQYLGDRASTQPQPLPDNRGSYREAVARATPSVVNIYTAKVVQSQQSLLQNPLFQQLVPRTVPRQRIERSLGSGVILTAEGHILTNNHVIDGADAIQVLLSDGRSASAEVIGTDSASDLAALKIDLPDLQPAVIADSDQIQVGDVVLAIGNPLGFGHSVTQGIISALGRYGLQTGTYEGFIQTDATVHPGNSGGALVDVDGRLVGINTLIFTTQQQRAVAALGAGISLAIPVNIATFVMQDLIRYGYVIRGWLGIQADPVLMPRSNLPPRQGLGVTAVAPGGPAEKAGLAPGDIITHFDNREISDVRLAMLEISLLRPGDRLEMTVLRGEQSLDLHAIVSTRPGEESGN